MHKREEKSTFLYFKLINIILITIQGKMKKLLPPFDHSAFW